MPRNAGDGEQQIHFEATLALLQKRNSRFDLSFQQYDFSVQTIGIARGTQLRQFDLAIRWHRNMRLIRKDQRQEAVTAGIDDGSLHQRGADAAVNLATIAGCDANYAGPGRDPSTARIRLVILDVVAFC